MANSKVARAATLKPRWNWGERFLSGSSPPMRVRIAITLAIVRPGHDAAIVKEQKHEGPLAGEIRTGLVCHCKRSDAEARGVNGSCRFHFGFWSSTPWVRWSLGLTLYSRKFMRRIRS